MAIGIKDLALAVNLNMIEQLRIRSEEKCELCRNSEDLRVYEVPPQTGSKTVDNFILICEKCQLQIDNSQLIDPNHWRCLLATMWSEFPAVQVACWRMLNRLNSESWAADCLDSMYLGVETLAWAKSTEDSDSISSEDCHKDCNGAILVGGDSVVLIKSLDVKGSSLNAKMGTVVKNIRLVENNTDHIEGKIDGQVIVILAKYVRKQGA